MGKGSKSVSNNINYSFKHSTYNWLPSLASLVLVILNIYRSSVNSSIDLKWCTWVSLLRNILGDISLVKAKIPYLR